MVDESQDEELKQVSLGGSDAIGDVSELSMQPPLSTSSPIQQNPNGQAYQEQVLGINDVEFAVLAGAGGSPEM